MDTGVEEMLLFGLGLVAFIVFDLLALRFGVQSWQDGGRNAGW
jgi:hypothetical protein